MTLPASFYQAEAAWLTQPDYRPTPADAEEDIHRIQKEFKARVDEFAREFFSDIEDSGHIEDTIENLRELIGDLEEMQEEMQEAEHVLNCQPDPDAEWDNRGVCE